MTITILWSGVDAHSYFVIQKGKARRGKIPQDP
jgi:hypothetical protein